LLPGNYSSVKDCFFKGIPKDRQFTNNPQLFLNMSTQDFVDRKNLCSRKGIVGQMMAWLMFMV